MKVLLDQGTPAPLRRDLPGHSVHTAYEMGWATLKNGEFLEAAQGAAFDAVITTDQNIRHQQNLSARRFGVLVLPTTDWATIRLHVPRIAEALLAVRPGKIRDISFE